MNNKVGHDYTDSLSKLGELIRQFIRSIVPSHNEGLATLYLREAASPILDSLVCDISPSLGVDIPIIAIFKLGPENEPRLDRKKYLPILDKGRWQDHHLLWPKPIEIGMRADEESLISAEDVHFLSGVQFSYLYDFIDMTRHRYLKICNLSEISVEMTNPLDNYLRHRTQSNPAGRWSPLFSVQPISIAKYIEPEQYKPFESRKLHILIAPIIVQSKGRVEFVAVTLAICSLQERCSFEILLSLSEFIKSFCTICGEISEVKHADQTTRYLEREKFYHEQVSLMFHAAARSSGMKQMAELFGNISEEEWQYVKQYSDKPSVCDTPIGKTLKMIYDMRKYPQSGFRMLRTLQYAYSDHNTDNRISLVDAIGLSTELYAGYSPRGFPGTRVDIEYELPEDTVLNRTTQCALILVLYELIINAIDATAELTDCSPLPSIYLRMNEICISGTAFVEVTIENSAKEHSIQGVLNVIYGGNQGGGLRTTMTILDKMWSRLSEKYQPSIKTLWLASNPNEEKCGISFYVPLDP
ncbi:MAG: hypothetical protein FVQ84_18930 [Planctomycetes bacterium]|nr:hypothetical protein [Planctomycetota bacterium]